MAGQLVLGLGEKPLGSGQLVFIRLAADPANLAFYFSVASSVYRTASFGSFVLAPLVAAASPIGYRASVYMATGLCFLSLLSSLPMLGKLRHLDAYLRPAAVVGEELGEEMYLMERGKEGGKEMRRKRKDKAEEEEEEGGSEGGGKDEVVEKRVDEVEEEVEVGKGGMAERKWEGWKSYLRGLRDPGFLLLLVRGAEGGKEDGIRIALSSRLIILSLSLSLSSLLRRWPLAPCMWRSRAYRPSVWIFCRRTLAFPLGVLPSLRPYSTWRVSFWAHRWENGWIGSWEREGGREGGRGVGCGLRGRRKSGA